MSAVAGCKKESDLVPDFAQHLAYVIIKLPSSRGECLLKYIG
jgi:hypothetical protein